MAIDCAALRTRLVVALFTFVALWGFTLSITRYSIPEEMEEGSFVANLAADLGLDVRSLEERNAKLDVIHGKNYLDLNKDTGELIIHHNTSSTCSFDGGSNQSHSTVARVMTFSNLNLRRTSS
uniref:Cadherin N-terminal domain-containing protein n=1 Tax=Oryzias latipes TaxID=8090 RepID=A0A3P9IUC9_ORYLA